MITLKALGLSRELALKLDREFN